jgi:hypothetical protein
LRSQAVHSAGRKIALSQYFEGHSMSNILKLSAALGFAVAASAAATSGAQAAPVSTAVAKIDNALATNVTTVQGRRWRGGWRGYGGRGGWRGGYGWRNPYRYGYGWGAGWPYYGFGTGLVIGSALAAPYYYGPPVYSEPPIYTYDAPAYMAPPAATRSGARQRCWVETDSRGYGYWGPC